MCAFLNTSRLAFQIRQSTFRIVGDARRGAGDQLAAYEYLKLPLIDEIERRRAESRACGEFKTRRAARTPLLSQFRFCDNRHKKLLANTSLDFKPTQFNFERGETIDLT